MPTMVPVSGVDDLIRASSSLQRDAAVNARLAVGNIVRAININPATHTRLPWFVRGKRGVVVGDRGVFGFPDTNSQLKGEKPQHVYSVMFDARELWGDAARTNDKVYLDLWEDYLQLSGAK